MREIRDNVGGILDSNTKSNQIIFDAERQPFLAGLFKIGHQRGLLDQTLVLFLTEFGRTPRINREGGRDHWGAAGSIFFAGGGVRGGQVIGGTDRQAAFPTGPRYGPGDVNATLYRAVGIDPDTLLYDRQNRPLPVLPQGEPIPGVLA